METLVKQALDFLYPPVCLYCRSCLLEEKNKPFNWFCQNCSNLIEFLTFEDRCRHCFESLTQHECALKTENLKVFNCFDLKSPVTELVKSFNYNKSKSLASSFAAFIVLQLNQLNIPSPDLIAVLPLTWQEKLFLDDLNQIVAEELSFFLKVPFQKILKASFVTEVGSKKNEIRFALKSQNLLAKKNILLISLSKRTREEWINISRQFDHHNIRTLHLMQFLV